MNKRETDSFIAEAEENDKQVRLTERSKFVIKMFLERKICTNQNVLIEAALEMFFDKRMEEDAIRQREEREE